MKTKFDCEDLTKTMTRYLTASGLRTSRPRHDARTGTPGSDWPPYPWHHEFDSDNEDYNARTMIYDDEKIIKNMLS